MPSHKALMYKNLGGFRPPVDKKLISNAYCIGNVVGFYISNELSILPSIPYLIRDEDDELLPSSAYSSFEGPVAVFLKSSSYSTSAVSLWLKGRVRDVDRVGQK